MNQICSTLFTDQDMHLLRLFCFKVIGGCISGRDELVSKVRIYHHVVGGVLNPVSWLVRFLSIPRTYLLSSDLVANLVILSSKFLYQELYLALPVLTSHIS